MINGGSGDDVISGDGTGFDPFGEANLKGYDDQIDGGDGFDIVKFTDDYRIYDIDVRDDGTIKVDGPEGHDTLKNVERIDFNGKTKFMFEFAGDRDDYLVGSDRDDKIDGKGGDDRLEGGGGDDTLTGGADADEFVFVVGESGMDTITDFETGVDKVILDGAPSTIAYQSGSVLFAFEPGLVSSMEFKPPVLTAFAVVENGVQLSADDFVLV